MSLEVIGAGYGRTGTESLRAALEILGFGPCHHMHAIRDTPSLLPDWLAFEAGEHRDWSRLFAGFRSQVDFPGAAYWRELAAHFPDAKVILSLRDPEAWFQSVEQSVFELINDRDTLADPHKRAVVEFSKTLIGDTYFEGRGMEKDYALARFNAHTENVTAEIAPERLLAYRVTDGWAPLCAHLGVPVPDVPYPFANTREEYREKWD